jgi:hypothetical protein
MSLYRTLLLTLCAATFVGATPALARSHGDSARIAAIRERGEAAQLAWLDRPRDQDRAFRATQEGRSMPLPQIERRVLPRMGGAEYLGPEIRGRTLRMKFLDKGQVIWVDVDPQTGRVIGKSDDN